MRLLPWPTSTNNQLEYDLMHMFVFLALLHFQRAAHRWVDDRHCLHTVCFFSLHPSLRLTCLKSESIRSTQYDMKWTCKVTVIAAYRGLNSDEDLVTEFLNAKDLLVPASQMWKFATFLLFSINLNWLWFWFALLCGQNETLEDVIDQA